MAGGLGLGLAPRPDLHMHSTASDGIFSPADLASEVKKAGLTHFALTDHETMLGLKDAEEKSRELGLTFIPGVEINTAGKDEVHILLYFVHEGMEELTALLRLMNEDRKNRGQRMIERLNQLGINISLDDVDIPQGVFCNRPHLAQALVILGQVTTMKEAFDRYLGVGKAAYVERNRVETLDLIALARRNGAVPILAHPDLIRSPALRSDEAIAQMAQAGLLGIEAYHSRHNSAACKRWEQTARRHGLLVTGGSDFHRPADEHGPLGCVLQKWSTVEEDLPRFLATQKDLIKETA